MDKVLLCIARRWLAHLHQCIKGGWLLHLDKHLHGRAKDVGVFDGFNGLVELSQTCTVVDILINALHEWYRFVTASMCAIIQCSEGVLVPTRRLPS